MEMCNLSSTQLKDQVENNQNQKEYIFKNQFDSTRGYEQYNAV